ncbi:hypothetical protein WKW79_24880 [Variovorax robiniae]|uniref:Uncharacterized protein n=1 Tax=Variovorax robiniae TaxID=1836199 RepID=A0ABU8XFM0_9BURK
MAKQSPPPVPEKPAVLAKSLKENKEAAQVVQKASDELAVVHAVLDQEVPKNSLPPEVDRAVERTEQIEKQLSASVEKLKKVNETLARVLPDPKA